MSRGSGEDKQGKEEGEQGERRRVNRGREAPSRIMSPRGWASGANIRGLGSGAGHMGLLWSSGTHRQGARSQHLPSPSSGLWTLPPNLIPFPPFPPTPR